MPVEGSAASSGHVQQRKRSLFNRPSWAKPQAAEQNEDIFSRSGQLYTEIAKGEEEKLRKRDAQHAEHATHAKRTSADVDHGQSRVKRRHEANGEDVENRDRTPGRDDQPDDEMIIERYPPPSLAPSLVYVLTDPISRKTDADLTLQSEGQGPDFSFSVESPMPPPAEGKRQTVAAIELSDDEDDEAAVEVPGAKMLQSPVASITPGDSVSNVDNGDSSDEEFPELVRRARERAQSKKQHDERITASAGELPPLNPSGPPPVNPAGLGQGAPAPSTADKDRVEVLITSRLPGTQPLIVRQSLGQSLRDARLTWCVKQRFTAEQTFSVFLTWRERRVFDVTTCKSLGIAFDRDGEMTINGVKDPMGRDDGKVHMEAITEEIFQAVLAMKRSGARSGQGLEDGGQRQSPPRQDEEPQIRVLLRAKGHNDFRLIVKPVRFCVL